MKLILVYNAAAGWRAGLFDLVHKTLSPSTYPCSLCAVTYGPLGMDKRWRQWLERLPFSFEALHREEFARAYPQASIALPAVLLERDGVLEPLAGPIDLRAVDSIEALVELLNARLATKLRPAAALPETGGDAAAA